MACRIWTAKWNEGIAVVCTNARGQGHKVLWNATKLEQVRIGDWIGEEGTKPWRMPGVFQ